MRCKETACVGQCYYPTHHYQQHTIITKTNLEDGCLWVAVDCHNDLAVLHACNMLDGATDAHSDVQLGRNNLARLANLQHIAGLACCVKESTVQSGTEIRS